MNKYRFHVVQDSDGWRYCCHGPINFQSRIFDTKHEAYKYACERGHIPDNTITHD
jgi:hypothetical protein